MSKKGKGKENIDKNMAQDNSQGSALFKFDNLENRLDALKEDSLVFAPMKDGVKQIAKIVACRIIKDEKMREELKCDLEYYVHYLGYNRRIDRWVPDIYIIRDDEKIKEEMNRRKEEEERERTEQSGFLENDEDAGMDKKHVEMHEQATKIKTIEWIQIGEHKCETWYFSPYPDGYHHIDCLYICHYCLNFFKCEEDMHRHSLKCEIRHPPGDEIYRDEKLAVFEVDGQREPIYCENLCYISKLFLDHKTLTYEVDPFLFYCMCEYDEEGYKIGGYFSKEKEFSKEYDPEVLNADKTEKERNFNNLSCIMVLPFHQRKGYGKFLISFSYELSILEGKQGTPERPLSDLGHKTYTSWWTWRLLTYLKEHKTQEISIQSLAQNTGILQSDIINLFESFKILRYHQGDHYFVVTDEFMDELIKRAGHPGHPVNADLIHWTGYQWYSYT